MSRSNLVVIAMPAVFLLMKGISRHYRRVTAELTPEPGGMILPSRIHAGVLVSRLHKPTLQALAYARATRPDSLTAITVASSVGDARALQAEWAERGVPVPLTQLDAPYRDITSPALDYVASVRRRSPRDIVVVYIPEHVVGHWWEHLLHNQRALRLKARLLFQRGVMVTSVPWQLESSHADERQVESPAPQPADGAGLGGMTAALIPCPGGEPAVHEPAAGRGHDECRIWRTLHDRLRPTRGAGMRPGHRQGRISVVSVGRLAGQVRAVAAAATAPRPARRSPG